MILVRFTGGLGNQMFQYAFAKNLALLNNIPLKLDSSLLGDKPGIEHLVVRHFDLDVFDISDAWATKSEIEKFNGPAQSGVIKRAVFKLRKWKGLFPLFVQKGHEIDATIFKKEIKNLCVVGRWQSEGFFSENKSIIKEIFNFNNFNPNKYSIDVAAKMKTQTSISVQVRRGDYITNEKYAQQIGSLTKDYFLEAMDVMLQKLGDNVTFYFVSDDIEWCKLTFGKKENVYFVEQEHSKIGFLSDMWLLSLANHSIISNSTFSWWGAWLGEKENSIIIAPKFWTRLHDESDQHCVPERWIKLSNEFESLS